MKIKNVLENFIILAIILVLIQTFLEELAILLNWEVKARNILTLAGLFFDFIFTVEFITRLVLASKKKKGKTYFFYERGWIDFLSSIPLLLLNSLPASIIIIFDIPETYFGLGIGIVNILKVVKAVRITRILRLIRILKIFGKIKNTDSLMAQRHISVISTTVCASIIFIILIFGFFNFPNTKELINQKLAKYKNQIMGYLNLSTRWGNVSIFDQLKNGLSNDKDIIKIEVGNEFFSNYDENYIKKYFLQDDYKYLILGQIKLKISIKDINKIESQFSIIFFTIICFLIIMLMTFYTRHFVQNITDLIYVMNKGFNEKDYLLEVKINQTYKDDDIYRFAKSYNEKWLSFKSKYQKEIYKDDNLQHIDISINDLFN